MSRRKLPSADGTASPPAPARKLRCAVYTRKSTEEGLEQAFNSLDAQRDACEAFVASQRAEGWLLVPDRYDDGGVSGGTLERPALKRLLADVERGLVDVVVVYKIDRLSRSLTDLPSWWTCSRRTGSPSSRSPRPSTRRPAWAG
jgi:site-specific DNA recombinase